MRFFQSLFQSKNYSLEENLESYTLEVEMPGIPKEAISISFVDDILYLEVKAQDGIKKERVQKYNGKSFVLENISYELIKAKYYNGLLTLFIPKKKAYKSSHIIALE